MLANDVILKVRSRLKDIDFERLLYSDEELLDILNHRAKKLNRELAHYKKFFSKDLQEGESIEIPNCLGVVYASFNGTQISNDPTQKAIELKRIHKSHIVLVNDRWRFFGVLPKASGLLEILSIVHENISDLEQELYFNDSCIDALVFGVCMDAFAVQHREDNANRIQMYEALYNKEVGFLSALHNGMKEGRGLMSKTIRI